MKTLKDNIYEALVKGNVKYDMIKNILPQNITIELIYKKFGILISYDSSPKCDTQEEIFKLHLLDEILKQIYIILDVIDYYKLHKHFSGIELFIDKCGDDWKKRQENNVPRCAGYSFTYDKGYLQQWVEIYKYKNKYSEVSSVYTSQFEDKGWDIKNANNFQNAFERYPHILQQSILDDKKKLQHPTQGYKVFWEFMTNICDIN